MIEKIGNYKVKLDETRALITELGNPMNLGDKDIFPIFESLNEDGLPRLLAGVVHKGQFSIKPFEPITRTDGETFWYQKLYWTQDECKAIEKAIQKNNLLTLMTDRVVIQEEEKKALASDREKAKKEAEDKKAAAGKTKKDKEGKDLPNLDKAQKIGKIKDLIAKSRKATSKVAPEVLKKAGM